MNSNELIIGMTLYCLDGSTVILRSIQKDSITVLYKGKEYPRPLSIIGQKLFLKPVEQSVSSTQTQEVSSYGKENNQDEFDENGYDRDGFNRFGYDINGYNRSGYDKFGYAKDGYNRAGYDRFGYDRYGYNLNGFNRKGYDRRGYDKQGYDENGFNIFGYDKDGYDLNGYNRDGYDKDGYDSDGYNAFDLNREMSFREGSLMSEKLKIGSAVLYHVKWGEGILVSLGINGKSMYLGIQFESGIKSFVYPQCFSDGHLYFEKTKEMTDFEDFLNTPLGRKIYDDEYNYLMQVQKEIENDVLLVDNVYSDSEYAIRCTSDEDWTPALNKEMRQAYSAAHSKWLKMHKVKREPYFARVDAQNDRIYIGRNSYKDIIEWTNPRASLYYEYQMYIGNDEYNLSLVRDIKLDSEIIYSIQDKYNSQIGENGERRDEESDVITDPNLLLIIKASREDKAVHDIISTIQQNQYRIITAPQGKDLLVLGCAGSGKTMILLHRLRYLMRNNSSLAPQKVFVISPTAALSLESNQLASILGMDEINVNSNIDMYRYVLQRICRKMEWFFPDSSTAYQENGMVDGYLLGEIYNENTLTDFFENTDKIIKNPNNMRDFITAMREEIRKSKIDFLGLSYNPQKEASMLKNLKMACEDYIQAKQQIKEYSRENILAFQKRCDIDYTKDPQKYKDALELLLKHEEMLSERTKYKTKSRVVMEGKNKYAYKEEDRTRIQDASEKVHKLYDFLERVSYNTDKSICGSEDPIDMFENVYLPIHCLEQRIDEFENGETYACLIDIVEFIIKDYKLGKGMDIHRHCEWELFAMAYVVFKFSEAVFDGELVFIDECQDYAISELCLLNQLFPKAIFNYFGDIKQAISPKSASSDGLLEYFDSKVLSRYAVNENYRNAREITEYVNDNMQMNMRPVGINGKVKEISFSDISQITINPDDRVTLVCDKSNVKDVFEYLRSSLKTECNLVSDFGDIIKRGIINVMPISLTKGLEFEKVIVDMDNMSENECYVACTRALNELYIIKNKS